MLLPALGAFAFMVHPETNQINAFIVASHEDHEGLWQEFICCDELLDCRGWDALPHTLNTTTLFPLPTVTVADTPPEGNAPPEPPSPQARERKDLRQPRSPGRMLPQPRT